MAIGRDHGRRGRPARRTTNNQTDLMKNVTRIQGRAWEVDYFHKQVSDTETVLTFDVNEPNHLKNFNRIKNMPLIVQDEVPIIGTIETLKGLSLIETGIKPTLGDIFIAQMLGGTDFLFGITAVKRKSYNNKSLYEIEYTAIKQLETIGDVEDLKKGLETGILEHLVYEDSFADMGGDPLITEEYYEILTQIKDLVNDVTMFFLETLIDNDSLFHPIVGGRYAVDMEMNRFIQETIPLNLHPRSYEIQHIIYEDNTKVFTILDLLKEETGEKSINPYYICTEGEMKVYDLLSNIKLNGSSLFMDMGYKPPPLKADGTYPFTTRNLLAISNMMASPSSSLIPKLGQETYIFQESFYGLTKQEVIDEANHNDNTPTIITSGRGTSSITSGTPVTVLEKEVRNYITGKDLDIKNIRDLLNESFGFTHNELIYFTPIILYMAKSLLIHRMNTFSIEE